MVWCVTCHEWRCVKNHCEVATCGAARCHEHGRALAALAGAAPDMAKEPDPF